MEFGKLSDITQVDFSLPEEHPATTAFLASLPARTAPPEVCLGLPVWSAKAWMGSIYPAGAKDKDLLKYYTRQFNTIELNTTHYRTPDAETIARWKEQTQGNFKFCPKLLQEITHDNQLKNAQLKVHSFFESIRGLEQYLGTCFIQLPPFFAPNQLKVLEGFVRYLPQDIDFAIEFRHPDWFKADASGKTPFDLATEMLEAHEVGTVICDTAGRRDVVHQRLTTNMAMLRFVGNKLHPTDYSRTQAWVARLKSWFERGLGKAYIFIHQPDDTDAPRMAEYFVKQLNEQCGLQVKPPQFTYESRQTSLF